MLHEPKYVSLVAEVDMSSVILPAPTLASLRFMASLKIKFPFISKRLEFSSHYRQNGHLLLTLVSYLTNPEADPL
jgi:hypothetical protein